jgi:hemoglobin
LYERVGGQPFFIDLVDRFYEAVADDRVLRPLYREGDLSDERRWLALFLVQYWGGPATYSEERGHPRLRMRHFPFAIGEEERDHWYAHMQAAVAASPAGPEKRTELLDYFASTADFLVNR